MACSRPFPVLTPSILPLDLGKSFVHWRWWHAVSLNPKAALFKPRPLPVRANRLLGNSLLGALILAAIWPGDVARAVVNAGGNANTTAPADDPGFANVGSTGGASIIYLGN